MRNYTVPQKDIQETLALVCKSPVFATAPRMQQLLRFLVEETLKGRAHQLKAYTIGLAVFGRDESFNPQLDPVVRVEMRRLRKKLEEYHERAEAPKTIIFVPKGGYVPEFIPGDRAAGAAHGDQSSQIMHFACRNTEALVIVVPFEDLSPEQDKEFFAAALTSDITLALSQIPGISVAGHGYARQMLRSGGKLRDFIRQVKAKFVVSGNIRIEKDAVRFSIELTDALNGVLLCAQSFDYPYTPRKTLGLQNILCQKAMGCLAAQLHVASGFLENAATRVAVARLENYEAILQFGAWEATLDQTDFFKARAALEEVVGETEGNAQTAAMLADIYASEYRYGLDQTPQVLEKSQNLAEMALGRDPDSPIANLALSLCYFLRHDQKRLHRVLEKAVNLKPNYNTVLSSAAIMLLTSGKEDLAGSIVAKTAQYRDFMPWWHYVPLFMLNYNAGDYKQALCCALRMRHYNFFYSPFLTTVAYVKLNMPEEAARSLRELQAAYPNLEIIGRRLLHGIFFYDQAVEQFTSLLEGLGQRLA